MTNAVVLGAGMIGSAIAEDLARDEAFSVTAFDARDDALRRLRERLGGEVDLKRADLSDPDAVRAAVESADVVFGALGSEIGFAALRAAIEAGKPICDICFMPEDPLTLDDVAKERGVAAVVDCGVAPGLSNIIAGCAAERLESCKRIAIYVGGLPRERRRPFEYKAAFSPRDVIEEYTRPARLVEHGEVVTREALSEIEQIDFPDLGTLEAFNTDGLRSLIATLDVPNMVEKTLRYPGHAELMRLFRETGLFDKEPVDAGGVGIRPIDMTAALLFPMWTYEPGEEDLTAMRIVAEGSENGRPTRLIWEMLDRFDRESATTSMARTTGFPCAIVGRMLARGEIDQTGVIPPDRLGRDARLFETIRSELDRRGVRLDSRSESV